MRLTEEQERWLQGHADIAHRSVVGHKYASQMIDCELMIAIDAERQALVKVAEAAKAWRDAYNREEYHRAGEWRSVESAWREGCVLRAALAALDQERVP